jgi:pimeloyl-ACP methyl ester carboxylesterase
MRLLGIPGLNRLMMALEPPSQKQVFTLWRRMGHDPEKMCPAAMNELMLRAEQLPNFMRGWLSLLENVLPFSRINPEVGFGEQDLASLRQPVLYVWGRSDPFGSLEVARRAQALTPGSQLEMIGVGHLPWLDAPEACGRVTSEFLRVSPNHEG